MVFLLTAAPASQAAFDLELRDSLLKKIYKNSSADDASNIYSILRKALDANPNEGQELVDALLKKLHANLDRLDADFSLKDLARVKKKLHKWLRTHRMPTHGGISDPESPTTNP